MVLLSSFTLESISQIEQGGLPFSFENPQLIKSALIFETMPAVDGEKLLAEDSINAAFKDVPWRFGENIDVSLNPNNSGVWDLLPKGDKIWRLGIKCPGAFTINLTFDDYHLPPGARLFVYNIEKTHIIGAFTDFNNQEDKVFATTLIMGDEIVIEYYEPPYPAFQGELNLSRVTHGYRDAYSYAKSFGSSGACNNNVVCPEGAGWENQVKSVCMLVSGGNGFCSGALVNNTNQNGIPYILTANHCYSDPSSWVFWFNWQSSTCTNPGSSPPYNSMSGATLKARYSDSDFCLVQINNTPPSNYNVYYSGWNRQDIAAASGAGIHHPSGDIKKISLVSVPFTSDTWSGTPANSHWKTIWSDGVTEPGSSGSPIFDQNHRVVGQLHGGPSCCTCTDKWDYYGKFSMSWNQGTTSATRLKDWLDPANISGYTLDGYDPNAVAGPPVANFIASNTNPSINTQVDFTDLSSNTPTSWSWSFNPATVTYLGGTTSSSKNPQVAFTAIGFYTVTLTATNSYGSDTETKVNYINVSNCTVTTFPWTQGFENGGNIPACWTQEYVNTNLNWSFQNGGYGGHPSSAHGGSYNAFLYIGTTTPNITKLVSPPLNLSALSNPVLTFWHTQELWSPDQDELRIYYKTSAGGAWTLLQSYTNSITSWTQETVNLPNPTGTYFIAFEGTAKYGYGVCLDDVTVNGTTTLPPVANFSANSITPYIGQTVTFTDLSTNSPTSWSWSFSPATISYIGGTSSSSQNPLVQFTSGGLYSVTLTATNAGGSDQEIKSNYISVFYAPVANFSADNTTPNIGQTVTFSDLTTNSPTSWSWSFSPSTMSYTGGTSSISQDPLVQFTAGGLYSVTLTATSGSGSDSETKTNYINASNCTVTSFPWTQGFENGGNIPACWTQEYVTNTLNWTFQSGGYSGHPGSAHSGNYNAFLYIASQTPNVTKLVTPPLNLSSLSNPALTFWHAQEFWSPDQDELRIYYKTSAGGVWSLLQSYTNNISVWTQETIDLPNPTGTYYIAFEGTAKYGRGVCLDDIAVNGTTTLPPVAAFSASTTTPYIGQTVTFTDLSTNSPTSWSWSFSPATISYAGGTGSSSQNPLVQFNAGGTYTVTLIAANAYGSDPETKTNYISVLYAPVADFSADNTTPTEGETVIFTDMSTNSPSSWSWSFVPGTITYTGGTTTASQNPQVQFNVAGNYTVSLIAANASGNDTETKADYIVVSSLAIDLELTLLLEGPFNGIQMTPSLNGVLPLNQPFNAAPWNYSGTESVSSIPNPNVIDWILVELRDAATAALATGTTAIARQAAFVQGDGAVIGIDGLPGLQFTTTVSNNLFVVVYHNNHLSIMSSVGLTTSGGVYTYNFSTGAGQVYGGAEGHKELPMGYWGMTGGDGDHNGVIGIADHSPVWENETGQSGYIDSDYNLDMQSDNLDKNEIWMPNTGKSAQVPD